ncbi:30S ribosomal protein S20 [Desulfovibrio inopinatus]|uniref:30S ribosomal protein S20 n=1 Tax=Desulfovibrio inopinatus TaxID=102109 RepID=UPI000410C539|nr:30S ribosomal protein S20 [Desulfovibrio inopinatus]
MANHKSALKRHRQNLTANARNRMMRTRIKNAVKKVRTAIDENNSEAATEAFKAASSILDKAAGKKVIHWKTAARKVSRLNDAVRKIEA